MTIGFKTLNNYYIELITIFTPRPITNETELIATQNRINSISVIASEAKQSQGSRRLLPSTPFQSLRTYNK